MHATSLPTEISSLDIATRDGICDARLAVPKGDQRYPGVLYYIDAFGVRPVTDEWIQRIAGQGYVVLAPNLLYRGGRSPILNDRPDKLSQEDRTAFFQRLRPMMDQLTQINVESDAAAYIDCLSRVPQTLPGPIGVTGYCMGARIAVRTAAGFPDKVAALAGFHAGNVATDDANSPHLLANKIKADVYMGYADHDQSMPPEQQERVKEAFEQAGVRYEAEVYADAPHGYTMSDTEAYREDAAERHFAKLIELLDRALKGRA